MKKAETRRPKEQNQNTEPLGTHLGKKMVMDASNTERVSVCKPRPRRAAFGDITNEQNKDTGLKAKKQEDARKSKQAATTIRIKPPTTKKKKGGAPVVTNQNKLGVGNLQCVSHDVPDGAELPILVTGGGGDVSMTEAECSPGLDDSRTYLEQSMHESSLMNAEEMPDVPTEEGVEDIDSENKDDISCAALYVHDIFTYYKEREMQFLVPAYMEHQPYLSTSMRAILVDWLVEVQENFELNHETLYLAVKLTDTYLAIIHNLPRDHLQLVGAAALFLACKFDERVPPAVEDFLYVCDDAYKRPEFLAMEREILRTVGFDLGRPISYRFLRRYAKCGRSPVVTLTLARYLLELSLMEYKFVTYCDSALAASCLYIARCMQQEEGWTKTLEYYSGYQLSELRSTILVLNPLLTSTHYAHLTTIRTKYNHVVFHCVGKIPPLSNSELFPDTDDQ